MQLAVLVSHFVLVYDNIAFGESEVLAWTSGLQVKVCNTPVSSCDGQLICVHIQAIAVVLVGDIAAL